MSGASEILELGFEAFDHVTEKYYDRLHDGVSGLPAWIKKKKGERRARSRGRRSSSVPGPDELDRGFLDSDIRGGRSRSRGRRAYKEYEEDEVRDRDGNIRVKEYHDSEYRPEGARDGLFNQAPLTNPPYPTAGEIAMPGGAPYPYDRDYPDYEPDRTRAMTRRNPSLTSSSSRSRSRDRDYGRDRSLGGHKGHHHHHHHRSKKEHKDYHISAGLAGAAAGAYVGSKVGKGDVKTMVAGAVVGALGAGVADRQYDHLKERRKREKEKEQEWSYGR